MNRQNNKQEENQMGKVEANKKKKKESLLNTAFELFTSKGINETSISDIVNKAGVAKGTFYLYFRDKYDVRNLLISHKSSKVFMNAANALEKEKIEVLEDKIIFIVDNIINQLAENKALLTFVSKNLSWGFFKNAITSHGDDDSLDFKDIYYTMLDESEYEYREPEIMIYMIVELVSSTIYSSILYNEPAGIEEIKPYLFETVRFIIKSHRGNKKVSD